MSMTEQTEAEIAFPYFFEDDVAEERRLEWATEQQGAVFIRNLGQLAVVRNKTVSIALGSTEISTPAYYEHGRFEPGDNAVNDVALSLLPIISSRDGRRIFDTPKYDFSTFQSLLSFGKDARQAARDGGTEPAKREV